MPNWNQVLNAANATGSAFDVIRRQYLQHSTKRPAGNVIAYYSGWLQKPDVKGSEINDEDKNGLMTAIHQLDRTLGLDLVLHTPGGETAATELIVHYLRAMFGTNIRAVVPQLAMSGGTMISCACREILMGSLPVSGPLTLSSGRFLHTACSKSSSGRSRRRRQTRRPFPSGRQSSPSTAQRCSENVKRRSTGPTK